MFCNPNDKLECHVKCFSRKKCLFKFVDLHLLFYMIWIYFSIAAKFQDSCQKINNVCWLCHSLSTCLVDACLVGIFILIISDNIVKVRLVCIQFNKSILNCTLSIIWSDKKRIIHRKKFFVFFQFKFPLPFYICFCSSHVDYSFLESFSSNDLNIWRFF